MSSAVIVKDRGLKKIFRNTELFDGLELLVGWQGSDGDAIEHDDSDATNTEIAFFHEFGTKGMSLGRSGATYGGLPERAPLRKTFDARVGQWMTLSAELTKQIYHPRLASRKKILGIMGEKVVGDIRATIRAGLPPPLMPSTIERKGSSKPLIDTGQLVQAITYRIKK